MVQWEYQESVESRVRPEYNQSLILSCERGPDSFRLRRAGQVRLDEITIKDKDSKENKLDLDTSNGLGHSAPCVALWSTVTKDSGSGVIQRIIQIHYSFLSYPHSLDHTLHAATAHPSLWPPLI